MVVEYHIPVVPKFSSVGNFVKAKQQFHTEFHRHIAIGNFALHFRVDYHELSLCLPVTNFHYSFATGLLVVGNQSVVSHLTLPASVLGLQNVSKSEGWEARWADGSPATLFEAFWDDSQPNVTAGHCVYVHEKSTGEFRWEVESCEEKRAFICQRPACSKGITKTKMVYLYFIFISWKHMVLTFKNVIVPLT